MDYCLLFPTVTDAVRCGIKIQKETKAVEDLNLLIAFSIIPYGKK